MKFEELEPRAGVARGAHLVRLHRAHADPGAGDSTSCSPAAISSARRKPARARRPRSCCRRSSALPRPESAPAPGATASPPPPFWCWRRRASSRSRSPSRPSAMAAAFSVNTVCIYGGAPYPIQNRDLARGADIIVATPGRLIDHLERGRIDLSTLEVLVLDEADRMLDMGFVDDVERIALLAPKTRQTVLFSATFDGAIARLSARLMRDAVRIDIQSDRGAPLAIEQRVHFADDHSHKHRILDHLLADIAITQSIVFIATKRDAESLAQRLKGEGHAAAALHGDMNQHERTRTHHRHAARARAHAGGHRRRRARHRRGRHQPRDQLRLAAAGRRLCPPDRPYRTRRRGGHRGVDREPCRTRRTAPDRALYRRCDTRSRNSRSRASSPRPEVACRATRCAGRSAGPSRRGCTTRPLVSVCSPIGR